MSFSCAASESSPGVPLVTTERRVVGRPAADTPSPHLLCPPQIVELSQPVFCLLHEALPSFPVHLTVCPSFLNGTMPGLLPWLQPHPPPQLPGGWVCSPPSSGCSDCTPSLFGPPFGASLGTFLPSVDAATPDFGSVPSHPSLVFAVRSGPAAGP